MEAMTFDELQHLLEGTLENADEAWKVWAYQCITQLADAGEPFTADEVHLLLEPYGVNTGSDNAMGALFARARREGLITTDNQYRPSTRREAHRRMVRIWKGA
jgi:hypothetical protein